MKKRYKFSHSVTNKDNFLPKYIRYGATRTDAAHDLHEFHGLFLLSAASNGLEIHLPQHPDGLQNNLYGMIHATSFLGRKSTAMKIARDIQERAIPGVALSEDYSPGGLQEEVASNEGRPSIIWADEFSGTIEKMTTQQYMSGLKAFLLTLYSGKKYSMRRTSKGTGKNKTADRVIIEKGHLCIAGNVTPTIAEKFSGSDIEDGFLGRFIFISPKHQPERMAVKDMAVDNRRRNKIVMHLSKIYQGCQNAREWSRKTGLPNVEFDEDALEVLDKFQIKLETMSDVTYLQHVMIQRLADQSFRVAVLIALGEVPVEMLTKGPLFVTKSHAKQALSIIEKWATWGLRFATNIGIDKTENKIIKIIRDLELAPKKTLPRSTIVMNNHLRKSFADELQMTLLDRGRIVLLEEKTNAKRKKLLWRLVALPTEKDPPTQAGGQTSEPGDEADED
jgi:hypothetical protein